MLSLKRTKNRQFLNWAQKAFNNYRAVPPATGIVHQVNLEYLANVVHGIENENGIKVVKDYSGVGQHRVVFKMQFHR